MIKYQFKTDSDSILEQIRRGARTAGYAGTPGLREFVKRQYGAKLNTGPNGVTSISYASENINPDLLLLFLAR